MTEETIVTVINTRLKSREEVAERTMAFRFEKPADWTFTPGQFMEVTLIDPPEEDDFSNTRAFSIVCAPQEDVIMCATRLTGSTFKKMLSTIPLGTEVKIEGPFGDLVLHEDASRAAVLLTGGIGITPFRSIVLDAAKRKLPHKIFLFYSNRRPEDAPFLADLQKAAKENRNFEFIATMNAMEKSAQPWDGARGVINQALLDKYLAGVKSPIYYITGPGGMVKAMHELLTGMGVKEEDMRVEEFPGY